MQIFDISQEVFSCAVYPGDPAPKKETLLSVTNGDACNLTAFSMCAHNGTHVDAPYHFLQQGATVDALPLPQTVGYAFVYEHTGIVTAEDALRILALAKEASEDGAKRILIKGKAILSLEGEDVFADAGILLFGNESQTVGPEHAPMAVHLALLSKGVALLEGIRLADVPCGVYLLCAAPLSLAGVDGAPCRAVLITL